MGAGLSGTGLRRVRGVERNAPVVAKPEHVDLFRTLSSKLV